MVQLSSCEDVEKGVLFLCQLTVIGEVLGVEIFNVRGEVKVIKMAHRRCQPEVPTAIVKISQHLETL